MQKNLRWRSAKFELGRESSYCNLAIDATDSASEQQNTIAGVVPELLY